MAYIVNTRTQLRRRAFRHTVWLAFLCVMFLTIGVSLGRSVLSNPSRLQQYVRQVGLLRAASDAIVQPIVDVATRRHKPAAVRRWLFVAGHLVALVIVAQLLGGPLVVINGYRGEKRVLSELRRLPDDYWVLNDVLVPTSRQPAQIDSVIVSPAGVWCLETRTHRGYVSGGEHDYEWSQAKRPDADRRSVNQFPSPVRQSTTHCACLKEYLAMQELDVPVKGMVVFTSASFEVLTITPVETVQTLVPTILRMDVERPLSEAQVQRVVESLTSLLAISPKTPGPVAPADLPRTDAPGTSQPGLCAVDPQSRSG